jgi:hypothetical protein
MTRIRVAGGQGEAQAGSSHWPCLGIHLLKTEEVGKRCGPHGIVLNTLAGCGEWMGGGKNPSPHLSSGYAGSM